MENSRTRIYVTNLNYNITDDVFVSYFRRNCAGVTLEQPGFIKRDEFGRSKGYGFIDFIDFLSASRVVSSDRIHKIDGRRVVCEFASQRQQNQNTSRNGRRRELKHLREIFVGNLNISTTEHQLKNYFSTFGSVVKAVIPVDENNRSKGHGHIEFQNSSAVDQVQQKRPHKIDNKEVQTNRCYPKSVPTHLKKPTTVLYVRINYNEHVDQDVIEKYFDNYGNITEVLYRVERSKSTKYFEIHFTDYDVVDRICLEGDEHKIAEDLTVIVTKNLEASDGLEKFNATNSNPEMNSYRSVTPSAPILSPPPPYYDGLQNLHHYPVDPYGFYGQQPPCESIELQAMNPQLKHRNSRSSFPRESSPFRYRSRTKSDSSSNSTPCCLIS